MRKSAMVGRHRAKTVSGKEILGLSHFLSGWKKVENVIYSTNIDNLFMVFAGREVPNPTEILERQNFQDLMEASRKNFDYVIVDCAPIGAAIDAAVIAPKCDGIVLVVAQDQVGSRSILAAKQQLEASGTPILGCVLNKVRMEKNKYYGKYYGNYYGNYYGGYYGHGDEQK
jgi:capsular exopolysaccharide synthesis family protein